MITQVATSFNCGEQEKHRGIETDVQQQKTTQGSSPVSQEQEPEAFT